MNKTLLEVKNLTVSYQTKQDEVLAVNGISFTVERGEFIALIGKSGCGKTSVLSACAGLLPYEGEIVLDGEKIISASRKTGYMLQRDELFEWLTIEKNACLPLKIRKKYGSKNETFVRELLDKYGLGDFKKSYPRELSGGMRQRAALIRTLATDPALLLLDEPFSALDYQTRLTVTADVYNVIKSEGKTAMLVTHDISEAISVADKIIVLSGRPARILAIEELDFDKALTPLERREQPQFSVWFEKLWRKLNE